MLQQLTDKHKERRGTGKTVTKTSYAVTLRKSTQRCKDPSSLAMIRLLWLHETQAATPSIFSLDLKDAPDLPVQHLTSIWGKVPVVD